MKIRRWRGWGGCWQNYVTVAKMAKENKLAFWLGENNEVPETENSRSLVRGLRVIENEDIKFCI